MCHSRGHVHRSEHITKMADVGTPQRPARTGKQPPKESVSVLKHSIHTHSTIAATGRPWGGVIIMEYT